MKSVMIVTYIDIDEVVLRKEITEIHIIMQKRGQISTMKLSNRGKTGIMKLYSMKLKPTITIDRV